MSLDILIVDDDAIARRRMRDLLARCGSRLCGAVEEAADAGRAAGLMRHRRFDLVLLDVQMPGESGLQLANSLRYWPDKPAVVFVTGYGEHALEAFEADAIDYLTKPVRPERLERALVKALGQRPPGATDGAPDERDSLRIVTRGQAQRLPLSEVLYLRAEQKRITVVTARGRFTIDGSLVDLENEHAGRLLRVHRHTLVARHAVHSIRKVEGDREDDDGSGWELRLRGSCETVKVARRMLKTVRESVLLA